jgi:glycosyl transferase, family 25
MPLGSLFEYFDRVGVIHLRERTDRYHALEAELSRVGLSLGHPKVSIPAAPMPSTSNGFSSRGVYGNFLSHVGIIEQAYSDGADTVLVLEDDAIFSREFNVRQSAIAEHLKKNIWDEFFIGHSITRGLPASNSGLVRFSGHFIWAHCYAIHRRIMPRIIDYFHQTLERDSGHPDGARMYIDGAHTEFRRLNPDVICLLSSPCLSVQKGSPSSLNSSHWYDRHYLSRAATTHARRVRDELWRRGKISVGPKGNGELTKIARATPWP